MAVELFIGSLSFSTSSERLRETFARIGAVESASVVTDRDTGRSRGFGFVEMATNEEANDAVARLNGAELDGRRIKVEIAKSGSAGGAGRGRATPRRRIGRRLVQRRRGAARASAGISAPLPLLVAGQQARRRARRVNTMVSPLGRRAKVT